jgi:hypothetical protein
MGGFCDFCGRSFQGEGQVFEDRGPDFELVKTRPAGEAAIFPWNVECLPVGCDLSVGSLQDHDVQLKTACPDYMRSLPRAAGLPGRVNT